jgi:hypothetical protein
MQSLQFGNFQLVAVAFGVLAMILFERGKHAFGGALLSFVALSKIFPFVLAGWLLFTKQWRALAWTAVWSALWTVLAFVVVGPKPFDAFVHYQLPRIADGRAFPMLSSIVPISQNHSFYGIFVKLRAIGVPGMTRGVATMGAWIVTAAIAGVTWVGAKRDTDRLARVQLWLALLQLASLRSPFTPNSYALFAPLWLFTLVLASLSVGGIPPVLPGSVGGIPPALPGAPRLTLARALVLVPVWLAMQILLPADLGDDRRTVLFHSVPMIAELGLTCFVVWRVLAETKPRAALAPS